MTAIYWWIYIQKYIYISFQLFHLQKSVQSIECIFVLKLVFLATKNMVLEGRGLASLQPYHLLFLWLLEKQVPFFNQKRPVNLYFFDDTSNRFNHPENHHLQNENDLKILQGVWTADFGSDWWIFTNIVSPCFSSLALDATRISNVLLSVALQCESENIYHPLNKHSTWKLMVGRWKFLLRWPIFSCELLVCRELF